MSHSKKNIPKRRFKKFSNIESWEQLELGEVIEDQYNGQTPSRANDAFWKGNINWLSSGELNKGIVTKTMEKITEAGQDNARLKIIPKGTFVLAITGLEAAGTRGNCGILGIDTALNQSCMALFPNKKKLAAPFLFQWYLKIGEEYGIRYTQGTKQQSYNAALIKILPIALPSMGEQVVIAEFLDRLDNTIALHQRKLEKIKALKTAYLSEMFPAEGETKPKRRFAGFTDDWEQRKFEDCFKFPVSTNSLSRVMLNYDKGEVKNVHYGDVLIKYPCILNIKKEEIPYITGGCLKAYNSNLLENGDLIFADAAEDETVGKAVEVNGITNENLVSGLHTIVARATTQKAKYFLGYYINSDIYHRQLLRLMQGSKVSAISKGNLQKTDVSFPKDIEEQQKIGSYFKQLDDTITLHQRKLQKLQNIKKAYLNEMFI
ncbi:restriction endonuclease subunit S [Listeria monocytogenes]|uniref:restriction endonuclease subunit S n=1 Tax=Listeria monocytogenes TaxID=1639 RepID=UPI0011EAA8C5|nr:restriction endonuclease subunit S [Listeria monocytogenes]ECQ0702817.1 hypothetical protein [Listeria monocytogenes]TYU04198.1 hypothetical protein FZ986_05755 [Listeria monocytogenes]